MSNYPPIDKSLFKVWLTVKLLVKAEPSFTEPAVRNLVFHAEDRQSSIGIIPGNGLAPHIRRIGSKLVLNHGGFLSWIDERGKTHPSAPEVSDPSVVTSCSTQGNPPAVPTKSREAESRPATSDATPSAPVTPKVRSTAKSKRSSRRRS